MNWLIFALLGPAIWSINNFLDKFILDKHVKEVGALTIIFSIANLIISIFIFAVYGFTILKFQSSLLILLAGMLQIVVFLAYFKALSLDETSRVVPLFQLIPVFTLVLGILFLGEFPTPTVLLGFLFVFIGGFILSTKKITMNVLRPNPAFWYMILASLSSATIGILFKSVVIYNDFWTTFAYESLGVGLGGFILFLVPTYRNQFTKTISSLDKKVYSIIVINEIIFVLGKLGPRFAFTLAPVALVTVVNGLQPFFILIYGLFLTTFAPNIIKEDISKKGLLKKFISILIIFLGIYLIGK